MAKKAEDKKNNVAKNRGKDFNIYYLNFSKVYEIAMMINNVIKTRIEKEGSSSITEESGISSSISASGNRGFLNGIKSQVSAEAKEVSFSSQKVVESLEVKTTKSTLLRSVIEKCTPISTIGSVSEGDLIKIDEVKFELFDEDSLRQFLILRRDALKGMRVEGMEVNNLVSSMLQDYAYILKGTVSKTTDDSFDIMIKIPMDVKSEFESQYSVDDLLIGHVSVIGIYKGSVKESFIVSNTLSYFGSKQNSSAAETSKIIKSDTPQKAPSPQVIRENDTYHFVDTIAIIQDVSFDYKPDAVKLHWWNKIGAWLSKLGRK